MDLLNAPKRERRRRWIFAIAGLAVLGGSWPSLAAPLEAAIEATFLYKFAPFVEWPPGSNPGDFSLCVVGSDPFSGTLDRAIAGERVGGHPIALHRLGQVTAQSDCAIMYIGGSSSQSVAQALTMVTGRPILTVTDNRRNGGPAGIINFVIESDHVRFAIDEAKAKQSGLHISSKLLSLAVSVKPAS